MNVENDFVIIGAGLAGLYAAFNLDKNLKVLCVCKKGIMLSNSSLAQGGIAAVFDHENDNIDYHFEDTMIAGGQENDKKAVEVLVKEGPDNVRTLMEIGVDFDKREDNSLDLTLEGGHSRHRILHYKDSTGREIVKSVYNYVKNLSNVEIVQNTICVSIVKVKNGFCLSLYNAQTDKIIYCKAKKVIIATGGIGRVYEYTTNSAIATGDGIMLAEHLGARIKNLSKIQFHPSAFNGVNARERFLISEAVRGEGAFLLNCNHQRFMDKYDKRLELAPRDIVSKAIMQEAIATESDRFFLDISHEDSRFIKERFPMIYENLLNEGFDLTKDSIPIFPCQHYVMGGIDVDVNAKTSVDGVYALGECSHTGVHGNNRLASNSLLEAVVFSRRAALDINKTIDVNAKIEDHVFDYSQNVNIKKSGYRTRIRHIMQSAHFVYTNKKMAKDGYAEACKICDELQSGKFIINNDYVEALSLATVAKIVLKEIKDI